MDGVTLRAVDDLTRMDLDRDAAAMVLAQSDAANAPAIAALCAALCEKAGGRDVLCTDDPDEGRQLLAARRQALPALERLGRTLLDDVAVPPPQLPAMIAQIQTIAARHALVIGTFGHAGDGNLHPTIVFDGQDASSEARARAAFGEILLAAIALGGTITGEHGVGSLKQPYLSAMLGETELALMKRIKASFDPRGILNPGRGL
jgi:D-lactate dehydrogenase (cytochrome)/glycolate oxidase